MEKFAPLILFIFLFPFFFMGMWCAVCVLLSKMGGWQRLAKSFPARTQPSGRRFFTQGGKVGLVTYRGCLTVYSSPLGLYLTVLFPFRFGHQPLFIPWDAMHNATTRRFLWTETVVFDVGSPNIATLQLPKKIFEGYHIAG